MLYEKSVLLINHLKKLIIKYGNSNQIREYLIDYFNKRNIVISYATRILGGKLPLETLECDNNDDLFILFTFTNGLRMALLQKNKDDSILGTEDERNNIDVLDYFTKLEVESFSDMVLAKDKSLDYPYVFHNMLRVSENHYLGIITSKYLSEIDKSNNIIYNFKTQRNPKIDKYGMARINIDTSKINQIKDRLLTNKQFADEIKLNVLHNGEDNVEFISKDGITGDVVIHSGEINIFDGYHRKTANNLALLKNPNLEFNWKISITNYTENKAEDFMVQINKQTPMKKEYIKTKNKNLLENLVVDYFIDSPICELADKIKDSDIELKYGGYTKKTILATAIKEQYFDILTSKSQVKNLADWIVEFMNYISQYLNKNNYSVHKNIFYAYISLSRLCYENDNWKTIVKEKISQIDFKITNPMWTEFGINNKDANKTVRDKLYGLFK